MVNCEPQCLYVIPQPMLFTNVFGVPTSLDDPLPETDRKSSGWRWSYNCRNDVGHRVPCASQVTQIIDSPNKEDIPVPSLYSK